MYLPLLRSGEAILEHKTKFSPVRSNLPLPRAHHVLFKSQGMKPPLHDQTTLLTVMTWSCEFKGYSGKNEVLFPPIFFFRQVLKMTEKAKYAHQTQESRNRKIQLPSIL